MSKTNFVEEAKFLRDLGISVIPANLDVKSPKVKWKEYQTRLMTDVEIGMHFSNCGGVIAICGSISRLFCIDFDLYNEMEHHDFWQAYTSLVPKALLDKCLINKTRSGGYHLWMRTDFVDKSRKLTRRFLSPSELGERYDKMLKLGSNHDTAMRLLLNNPTTCVIETRGDRSYGVFLHEAYKRHSGTKIGELTISETNLLIDAAYSLDCTFKQQKTYVGHSNDFRVIEEFKADCGVAGTAKLLEMSGLYKLQEIDGNGNYRMKRIGSNSQFSGYCYGDTGLFKSFGDNVLSPDTDVLNAFEIFCIVNEYDRGEGISRIKELRRQR